jgi:hypothetical protein
MKMQRSISLVLWYECIGFILILVITWLDELTGIAPHLFGGAAPVTDWRDNILETVLIIVVWAVVFVMTKRLVDHSLYLKGLLRICAWCRKIGYQDKWVPMEQYFTEGFQVHSTHGICPECLKRIQGDTAELRRKESELSSPGKSSPGSSK